MSFNTTTNNTTPSFCASTNPTLANIIVNGQNIMWYNNPTGGNSISENTNLINGATYYASQTQNNCESLGRLEITVTVSPSPNAGIGSDDTMACNDDNTINLNTILVEEDSSFVYLYILKPVRYQQIKY